MIGIPTENEKRENKLEIESLMAEEEENTLVRATSILASQIQSERGETKFPFLEPKMTSVSRQSNRF